MNSPNLVGCSTGMSLGQFKKFSTRRVKTPGRSVPWGRPGTQTLVSLRFVRRIARQGGEARAQKLTPAQRTRSARKAAKARWRKPKVVEITKRVPGRPGPKTAREKLLTL
jgi:hypothetical protein